MQDVVVDAEAGALELMAFGEGEFHAVRKMAAARAELKGIVVSS